MAVQISRQLIGFDQQRLRAHIPESNRLGDLSIKWRRFGEMAVTLVERREYLRNALKQAGRLASRDDAEIIGDLNDGCFARLPNGNSRFVAEAQDVDYFGSGPYRSIAYILDARPIVEEHRAIIRHIDRLNGVTGSWREYEPYLSVATIPAEHLDSAILDVFWGFVSAENSFTFERLRAVSL